MSPEHLRGEPCDARSDVYALGCVLYAALTGDAPFRRATVPQTMSAHLHQPPPRPSDHAPVPAEFDRVVERALAKRPEDRYPSAGDLGRAVLAAAAGEPVTEQERTVATGAAAPAELTTAMPTELLSPPEPEREQTDWQPPEHAPALTRQRGWSPRRGALGLLAVAAISTTVAAVMIVRGEGGIAGASTQLSTGEVRDAADAFAKAIAAEDSAALSRVLARDVKRVFPADSQRGRAAVLATYRGQFKGNEITGYDLSDLDVGGGRAGRAEGSYELRRGGEDPTGGQIVLGVKRERGRAKVALIAAQPGG
jgi:ketosteroid isomerase-like protein